VLSSALKRKKARSDRGVSVAAASKVADLAYKRILRGGPCPAAARDTFFPSRNGFCHQATLHLTGAPGFGTSRTLILSGVSNMQTVQPTDRSVLSARNHLRGTIDEIQWGDVLVHVTVKVGAQVIEAVITRRSAEELHLKEGDAVTAVVKATEVMLAKP
jgi:molybdopterin-binding protein